LVNGRIVKQWLLRIAGELAPAGRRIDGPRPCDTDRRTTVRPFS
jgi:hypothetical protein